MKPIIIRKLECGHWTMILVIQTEINGVFITSEVEHGDFWDVLVRLNSFTFARFVSEIIGNK